MTYPAAFAEAARVRAERGESISAIARELGVARATVRSWLLPRAEDLTPRDCWRCDPRRPVPTRAYAYLLGLYLGDGYISAAPRAYRLRIVQDARYERLIASTVDALAAVLPGSRVSLVRRTGCVEIGSYSQHWPCLFPQHGPGRKHERDISLAPWQRTIVANEPKALLRGLIESDGDRHPNRVVVRGKTYTYSRYGFTNASEQLIGLFTDTCDMLGVHWTRDRARRVTVSRRRDCAFLDTFIGPKS